MRQCSCRSCAQRNENYRRALGKNDDEGYVMSEIVGVVAPMRFHAIDEMAPLPVIYCSLGQAQRPSLTLFVRSTSGVVTLERPIRDAISSIDPALRLFDVRPMTDRV